MLRNIALGLAAAASLALGAAQLTPALANYAPCDEQPEAKGCPGYIPPVVMGSESLKSAHPAKYASNHVGTPAATSPNSKSQY